MDEGVRLAHNKQYLEAIAQFRDNVKQKYMGDSDVKKTYLFSE